MAHRVSGGRVAAAFVAFAASADEAPSRLYVRRLSAMDVQVVPRTDGALQPFWSPDSRALGYFARGKLMKVALDGGAPVQICAAPNPRGGAWGLVTATTSGAT